jgi:Tol biopolymer transport system component
MIEFEQKLEKMKVGTGSGRPGEMGIGAGVSADKIAEGQQQNVARLTLLDETISEFVNQKPIPGLMFSWGPAFSGAIAYTTREAGQLILLDRNKHKQTVSGVKDALLPAWSTDGTRLAWVRKDGRRKYTLVWATVSTKG